MLVDKKIKPTKQQLFNEEQKKLLKNRKVVQLNKFIKGDVSAFSVNDLKIFKLIISKVDSKESLFRDFYEITTDEIKALNINDIILAVYKDVVCACEQLDMKPIMKEYIKKTGKFYTRYEAGRLCGNRRGS